MSKQTNIIQLIKFLKYAEKLKTELRHSWTSDPSRQESVAEHTWMMSLIAITLFDEIDIEFDQLKALKMIIIHDLVESVSGDIPIFEISDRQSKKQESERLAIKLITKSLPNKKAEEIVNLWDEFEECFTSEARIAMAMDKIEALIQHNIADIETWGQGDYDVALYAKDHFFDFDKCTRYLKDEVDKWTVEKLTKEGDLSKLKPEEFEEFRKRNNL